MGIVYVVSGNFNYAEVIVGDDGKYCVEMYTSRVDGEQPVWITSKFRLSRDEAIAKADAWVAPPTTDSPSSPPAQRHEVPQ